MKRAQESNLDTVTKQGSRWPGKQSNNPKVCVREFPFIFFTPPQQFEKIFLNHLVEQMPVKYKINSILWNKAYIHK